MPARSRLLVPLLAALGACSGTIDGGADRTGPPAWPATNGRTDVGAGAPGASGTPTPPASAGPGEGGAAAAPTQTVRTAAGACSIVPGRAPLRLLSAAEYNNTLRDLLGLAATPNVALPSTAGQFLGERAMEAAEAHAAKAVQDLAKLAPCDVVTGGETCARTFITTFGRRAFRRPLDGAVEVPRYLVVFKASKDGREGAELAVRAFLQSPHFLYRPELGLAGTAARLSAWEVASRLSYLLLRSMPDEALLAAAESGRLLDPAEVARQALRLLDGPRGRATVGQFHEAWLEYGDIEELDRSAKLFPTFTPELRALLHEETRAFLESAFFGGPSALTTMLEASYTYMNKTLAAFYGVPGPRSAAFEKVSLDGGRRFGVLTHAGFLAAHNGYDDQTDTIHRGLVVRTRLFCGVVPGAPDDVPPPPRPVPGETARERFDREMRLPGCNACHQLMNPLGFAFERYDPVWLYRTSDAGKPVNDAGEMLGTDVPGPFTGVRGLVDKLKASNDVLTCLVRQWFSFALSRDQSPADDRPLRYLTTVFTDSRQDLRQTLLALVQTSAFLALAPASAAPGGNR